MKLEDLRRLSPPDLPGVYLMRDQQGKIIYIGKAVSLSKRLVSYFRTSNRLDPKTRALVSRIKSLEYLATSSEVEALVLENNLIKKHSPRYNILLRDDKSYPYLKLTVQEEFPRLMVTRKPFIDEARYFGPFPTASLKDTARFISRHFRLRLCQTRIKDYSRRKRPCLYLQMGQCDGICAAGVQPKVYARRVKDVVDFLEGGTDSISSGIRRAMQKASDERRFEQAALLRDQLDTIQKVRAQPVVSSPGREDRDILGLARARGSATVELFNVRAGNLEGRRHYYLQHVGSHPTAEILSRIIVQYYSRPVSIPPEVILTVYPQDKSVIQKWLKTRRQGPVALRLPENAEEAKLLKMAEANAWLYLKQSSEDNTNDGEEAEPKLLKDLAYSLDISGLPRRLEGYDISNISGQDAVGSRVVFVNGKPDKSAYRHYRIRTVKGADDFAMLQEVLFRRLRRVSSAHEPRPDLIVVDGGAGQVSAGRAVLRELELEHLAIVGLAKKEEKIYLPEKAEPLCLPRASPALKILIQLRDEAHRFALTYHRKLRSRRMHSSSLDRVIGLGPARRSLLLRKFGSVEAVLEASEKEISALPGISLALARRIKTQ